MIVQVALFARARDLAGSSEVSVKLPPGATIARLRQALVEQCPALSPVARTLLMAVADDYAGDQHPLCDGTVVSCFPPVSGG